jgi:hypothetical protein
VWITCIPSFYFSVHLSREPCKVNWMMYCKYHAQKNAIRKVTTRNTEQKAIMRDLPKVIRMLQKMNINKFLIVNFNHKFTKALINHLFYLYSSCILHSSPRNTLAAFTSSGSGFTMGRISLTIFKESSKDVLFSCARYVATMVADLLCVRMIH